MSFWLFQGLFSSLSETLTKWENSNKREASNVQFSVERVTPTLGGGKNLRIIANEAKGCVNGQP